MPRPRKFKQVCALPKETVFGPMGQGRDRDRISLTVEAYEVIRMMDLEGFNQEACARSMGVARSTVQRIYDEGRKIIADSIVNGKILVIEGGDYKLCDAIDLTQCQQKHCRRRLGQS